MHPPLNLRIIEVKPCFVVYYIALCSFSSWNANHAFNHKGEESWAISRWLGDGGAFLPPCCVNSLTRTGFVSLGTRFKNGMSKYGFLRGRERFTQIRVDVSWGLKKHAHMQMIAILIALCKWLFAKFVSFFVCFSLRHVPIWCRNAHSCARCLDAYTRFVMKTTDKDRSRRLFENYFRHWVCNTRCTHHVRAPLILIIQR